MRITRLAIRRPIRALVVFMAVLALAGPVAAKSSVDPNTLNPPPPDFFNATCARTGSHILCNLAFSDPDIVDEPSGIVCGATELLFSQQRSVVGKRFYDAAGNLTQRHFRESLDGTFTNPDTDKVATWTQHDTVKHDLAVPGDVTSGTTHISGLFSRVTGPNGGTILTDVGMFLVVEATGETLHASGHHPFDDYFANGDDSALAPLCDALG
jgi:hypothetical protein